MQTQNMWEVELSVNYSCAEVRTLCMKNGRKTESSLRPALLLPRVWPLAPRGPWGVCTAVLYSKWQATLSPRLTHYIRRCPPSTLENINVCSFPVVTKGEVCSVLKCGARSGLTGRSDLGPHGTPSRLFELLSFAPKLTAADAPRWLIPGM